MSRETFATGKVESKRAERERLANDALAALVDDLTDPECYRDATLCLIAYVAQLAEGNPNRSAAGLARRVEAYRVQGQLDDIVAARVIAYAKAAE